MYSVLSGLLWREQEAAVVYGSIDGGKTIGADPKFCELVRGRRRRGRGREREREERRGRKRRERRGCWPV